MATGSAERSLEARILTSRKLSLDGTRAIYDLTWGIDFSKPRRTAEAIARVVWEQDAKSWWTFEDGEPVFAPRRKVEILLPRDPEGKAAKAAQELRADLKTEDFAPFVGSYVGRVRDNKTNWLYVFLLGPFRAWIIQNWENRAKEQTELDRLFAQMAGYIILSPT
jgi:hypothetical protein